MEHLKLESITDSPDFWNDPFAISSYCNSILQATKKEQEEVTIVISDYNTVPRVSYEKRNSINKYHIYLPKLKDFYIDESIQGEDIKLRKAFLKHELAHIIYSEMESYVDHHQVTEDKIRFLSNAIEDVRIENFFGKRFPGANDTFFEVQNKFFMKGKSLIENEPPCFKNLALYFMYRSKKFEFEETLPIQIYNSVFEKHSDFLYLSQKELFELLEKIKGDFQFELDSKKDSIDEYKEDFPEKEKRQINQDDLKPNYDEDNSNEVDSDVELEIQNNSKNPSFNLNENEPEEPPQENSNSKEKEKEEDSEEEVDSENNSESDQDSEDLEDSEEDDSEDLEDSEEDDSEDLEDQEEDLDEDHESEEEEQKEDDSDEESGSNGFSNESNNSDSQDNESLSSSDFSDMIREQMQKNLDRENKNIDDFNSENEVSENSIENLKTSNDSENNFLDILKLIDYVPEDYINKINSNSEFLDDFLKYNNSKMKSKQSKIVDISRYISILTSKKKKGKVKKVLNQNSRTFYSVIASKNNKNIVSLVNFFKLKFQDKEKSKRFFNKENGDLHNESLYKMFGREQDQRIFSSIQRTFVTKQDVSFLLDFSGSMSGSKVTYLLESLVILNEVFSKLEIPYNVFSFTGRAPFFNFDYNSLSEKTQLLKSFSKYFTHEEYNSVLDFRPVNSNLKNVTFCLVNRNSKPEERKKIINLMISMANNSNRNPIWNQIFGGGTPEIQSMIALYNTLPKQKLFLINDGEYDRVDFFGEEINKISSVNSLNFSQLDFFKLGLNFLSGKKFQIKNFQEKTLFISMLRMVSSKISYKPLNDSNINKFFFDGNDYQQDELKIIYDIIYDYSHFISDIIYSSQLFENKDHVINSKFFKLEKTYNPRTDSSTLAVVVNKTILPTFKLKVYNKIVQFSVRKKYDQPLETHKVLLNLDEVTDILDVYKVCCFNDLFKLVQTVERNDVSQYTYRDLINKMRNSGWGIFGIGIESDYGKNYIGDSNFTYVKNYSDIRQNLEKKVKKII